MDLTAAEQRMIRTAAMPVPPDRRSAFVDAVLDALALQPEPGPGAVFRAIAAMQVRYRDVPQDGPRI
jgi:hypothetical protein